MSLHGYGNEIQSAVPPPETNQKLANEPQIDVTANSVEYHAAARFKVLRNEIAGSSPKTDTIHAEKQKIIDDRNFVTRLRAIVSRDIVRRVCKRLTESERAKIMTPYAGENWLKGSLSLQEVVDLCREITPNRETLTITIGYKNPDRETALKTTKIFVEEIMRAIDAEATGSQDPLLESLKGQNDQVERDIVSLKSKLASMITPLSPERTSLEKEIANKEELFDRMSKSYEIEKKRRTELTTSRIRLIDPPAIIGLMTK